MRSVGRRSVALFHGSSSVAPCTMLSGVKCSGKQFESFFVRDGVSGLCQRFSQHSLASVTGWGQEGRPPMLTETRTDTLMQSASRQRFMHSSGASLQDTPTDAPNSVAAALAARPPEPPLPYDSDENSVSGAGEAPFVPPPIDKLIKVIMRHGKKEQARRIVFDATHAMYNSARAKNPRPELRQRHKDFAN